MTFSSHGGLTRAQLEKRRTAAAADIYASRRTVDIANKYGVSRVTVGRWRHALAGNGVKALRSRTAPGRPYRLTEEQRQQTVDLYRQGPRAAGIDSDRWIARTFGEAITARFGVNFHEDHAGKMLRELKVAAGGKRRVRKAAC